LVLDTDFTILLTPTKGKKDPRQMAVKASAGGARPIPRSRRSIIAPKGVGLCIGTTMVPAGGGTPKDVYLVEPSLLGGSPSKKGGGSPHTNAFLESCTVHAILHTCMRAFMLGAAFVLFAHAYYLHGA